MAPAVADLVELLSRNELLDPVQLHELASWQQYYDFVPDLLQELLERGWLTPYQVDRLNDPEPTQLAVGPYLLLEELGQGGMGCVYKARHRRLDRIVALKVIHPSDITHPEAVSRFQREAKAVARLRHPNIVLLYDADQIDGTHFLALEYVQGVDLERLLVQQGPLPVPQACDCIRQAALGLQHAHERGLVHRDIKPSNLFLTRYYGDGAVPVAESDSAAGGVVKILDLGLARFSNIKAESEKLSIDGVVVGTPDYLAPEQALDSRKVDIRADIYSLGCTFYELLAGQPPFAASSGTQKLVAHIQEEPPALAALRGSLPEDVVRIVQKMMAKKPEDRYQTPQEVAEVLAAWGSAVPTAAVAPRRPERARPVTASGAAQTGVIRVKPARAVVQPASGIYTQHPRQLPEHTAPVHTVAFSPDGRFALTGGEDKALCLWDMTATRKVRRLAGHTDTVVNVVFAPDCCHALSCGRDRNVFLWNVESGQLVQHLKGATAEVWAAAFSPDGRTLLTGGQDMTLSLWDRQSFRLMRTLGGLVRGRHFGPITGVSFTADSARALSCSTDGTIRLWNVKTGAEVHCFSGHKGGVTAVAPSPAGLHFASGGDDRTVRTWGVVSGEELTNSAGHTSGVRGVAFLPGGLILSADDTTLRVWELATGREVFHTRNDVQKILCVAASPDGGQVLTGGRDKYLYLWQRSE
jgi:serine/threonine protein kinase